MKRRRDFQKNVAQQVEKNPGRDDACESEHDPAEPGQARARQGVRLKNRGQARSAEDPAFMFGNAFPAKVPGASRTARDGFTCGMIPATLRD
jgi:hypothetical protein